MCHHTGEGQALPDVQDGSAEDIHEAKLPDQQGSQRRGGGSTDKGSNDVAAQAMDIDSAVVDDGAATVRDDTDAAPKSLTIPRGLKWSLCTNLKGCILLWSSASQALLAPSLDAGSKARDDGRKRLTPMQSGAPRDARGETMASVLRYIHRVSVLNVVYA
jgi:hypothetical protein